MKQFLMFVVLFLGIGTRAAGQQPPKMVVGDLQGPTAVTVGPGGKIYVTVSGESGKDGEGAVMSIEKGKAVAVAHGLNSPGGLVAFQQWLYVVEKRGVVRIDGKGKSDVLAPLSAFPTKHTDLLGITVDPETGTLYVTNVDKDGRESAIFRVTPPGKVTVVADAKTLPPGLVLGGLAMDGQSNLLVMDFANALYRVRIADGKFEKLVDDLPWAKGVARDRHGRVFFADLLNGRVYAIPRPGAKPVRLPHKFQGAESLCIGPSGKTILVVEPLSETIAEIPISIPGHEVDETPLALRAAVAFPNLKWTGWKGETEGGKLVPLRPIALTHAGDGSDRVFVATQHGVIHVFPNDQKATKTTVFLDIQERVRYNDFQNEEGFLGLAFHPKFKDNGEFFVFYTPKKIRSVNVLSRFRVHKDDPNRADPDSEEELMRFTKPFWNHDGGTICFGPDGFLYVTHGDGGMANDPYDNGQNLKSLLGKVHRIDVDRKDPDKNYAIPKDNPFVEQKDARPEIWAYGLRNVWRMSFDRKTGQLWAGDVGQNLFEEINLIQRGGNYGWNRREGLHPFGAKGAGPRPEWIDPIWEYDHDTGKSITGGHVYRGERLPELQGHYLYADYVTAKIWALRYDEAKGRVVANRPIKDPELPIFSFGEDEKGEAYFLTGTIDGKGIYWFTK